MLSSNLSIQDGKVLCSTYTIEKISIRFLDVIPLRQGSDWSTTIGIQERLIMASMIFGFMRQMDFFEFFREI
jgi:hypothetical protein